MAKNKRVVRRGKPDFAPVVPPMDATPAQKTASAKQSQASVAGDLLSEIDMERPGIVEIDITAYCKTQTGDPKILTWQCPSVQKFYQIAKDGEQLARENPLWEKQLAYDVATMAACHVAPSTRLPVGRFYGAIAKMENPALWFYLGNKIGEVFPHLSGNTPETYKKALDAVVSTLRKHPEQCGDLSSETVKDLIESHDRQQAGA